jgi:short-subunit dehydrogenase
MQIKDKVFVVTGAGNGIGREVALGLLSEGAHVALVDLNAQSLEESRQLAGGAGGRASLHVLNVSDSDAVTALPGVVTAAHGTVDGVINVAGIIHRFVPVTDLSGDELERIINVNLWGTVNMCLAFLGVLRERPEASLVNVSSLSALIPFAGQTFYGATKAAVKQFSEGLYQELSDTNVAVTTVFPGNISTNLSGNSGVKMIDAGGRKVRATTPEHAGRKILDGVRQGSFRVVVGSDARLLDTLTRLSPKRATDIIARQMKSVLQL